MLINVVQEPAELPIGVGLAFVLGQRDVLLRGRKDQTLGMAYQGSLAAGHLAPPG